ncbi:MAG: hypothetical protein PWP52_365 [Bacteroidales bacterium]|nr:hypothetical protein [Bacteroidales bacterium]
MATIELDQSYETPVSRYQRGKFSIRYGYSRANDSIVANLRGEDYLVFKVEAKRLAFAVCDGVGSSFFGGLASQILGECIIEWLWNPQTRNFFRSHQDVQLSINQLITTLNAETNRAKQLVAIEDPYKEPNRYLRTAYIEKLKKAGSQSNFVCGYIEVDQENANEGELWLFWLGDARMELWNGQQELSSRLNADWLREQAWSSSYGILGDVHGFHTDLCEVSHVIAYSDGLLPNAREITPAIETVRLEEIIKESKQSAHSDDISYLEISLNRDKANLKDDLVPLLRQIAVPGDKATIMELDDADETITMKFDDVPVETEEPSVEIDRNSSETENPPEKKKSRIIPILFYILSGFLILSALILGFFIGFNIRTPEQVPTPLPTEPTVIQQDLLPLPMVENSTSIVEPEITQPINKPEDDNQNTLPQLPRIDNLNSTNSTPIPVETENILPTIKP